MKRPGASPGSIRTGGGFRVAVREPDFLGGFLEENVKGNLLELVFHLETRFFLK